MAMHRQYLFTNLSYQWRLRGLGVFLQVDSNPLPPYIEKFKASEFDYIPGEVVPHSDGSLKSRHKRIKAMISSSDPACQVAINSIFWEIIGMVRWVIDSPLASYGRHHFKQDALIRGQSDVLDIMAIPKPSLVFGYSAYTTGYVPARLDSLEVFEEFLLPYLIGLEGSVDDTPIGMMNKCLTTASSSVHVNLRLLPPEMATVFTVVIFDNVAKMYATSFEDGKYITRWLDLLNVAKLEDMFRLRGFVAGIHDWARNERWTLVKDTISYKPDKEDGGRDS
ncbi:hypothetical protein M426DRAFT_259792 [Hypoxylon sp. CI-4A]|nr:hypothetical protein M426DRAFT_259792 [Hypoxylon sp. CI-4A]